MLSIFFLEDNPSDRILFEMALNEIGFAGQLYIAHNCSELQDQIHLLGNTATEDDTNIFFMDMILTKDISLDFLSKLKNIPLHGHNYWCFLTGFTNESYIHRAYQLGINAYLFKPTYFPDLISLLQSVLKFLGHPHNSCSAKD